MKAAQYRSSWNSMEKPMHCSELLQTNESRVFHSDVNDQY